MARMTMGLAVAAVSTGLAASAMANRPWQGTDVTWTGSAADGNWGNAGNWTAVTGRKLQTFDGTNLIYTTNYTVPSWGPDTATVTVPGNTLGTSVTQNATTNDLTYDNVIFGAATNMQVDPDLGRKIVNLTFNSAAGNYVVGQTTGANQLVLNKIIAQGSSGTITFNSPLRFLGDGNVTPSAGRTVDVKGVFTLANGRTLLFDQAGTLNLNRLQSDSASGNYPGLRVLGTSGSGKTLNLNAANFRINLTVDAGQTITVNLNAADNINGTLNLGTGCVYANAANVLSTYYTSGNNASNLNVGNAYSAGKAAYMRIGYANSFGGANSTTTVGNTNASATAAQNLLLVNNPIASAGSGTGNSDVVVQRGTLGGGGRIANNDLDKGSTVLTRGVTVNAGGALAPGAALGTTGTLTMDLGSKGLNISGAVTATNSQSMLFDLASPANSDRINLLNTGGSSVLNIGAGVLEFDDFAFAASAALPNGTYTLFDTNAAITGSLGSSLTGTIPGTGGQTGTIALSADGQDVVLLIPEPGTLSLIGVAGALLLGRRRRVANA